MALLFRDFDMRIEIRSTREGLIRFRQHADAVFYLRKHSGRPGLITSLRQVLAEHHHIQVRRLSDDEVIEEVARRLLNGSLQLMEMFEPRVEVPTTPQEKAAEEEAPAVYIPAAAMATPTAPAVVVPEVPLLPLLEEVQIEGAIVLPEIMQTLAQIDLTLGGISLATVSLEPAPSGVPPINSAMRQVSTSAIETLEAL